MESKSSGKALSESRVHFRGNFWWEMMRVSNRVTKTKEEAPSGAVNGASSCKGTIMRRRNDRRPAHDISLMESRESVKILSKSRLTDYFWLGGPLFAMAAK